MINVHKEILEYCRENVIPQYQTLDLAHQPNHVYDVIRKSFEIAKDYDGYLKLWLKTKDNDRQLGLLRTIIDDDVEIYDLSKKIYNQLIKGGKYI